MLRFLKPDAISVDSLKQTIDRAIYTTNHEILASDFDTNLSGSTLVTVTIFQNKILCGNVGDSRAVVGKQMNPHQFAAVPLSIDHKPSFERER